MCGLTGVYLDAKAERTDAALDALVRGFTRSLVLTSRRGRDATGALIAGPDGIRVAKEPLPAYEFTQGEAYAELMASLRPDDYAIVGHTRWATKGSPKVETNNHPLIGKKVIGVHNGMVSNEQALKDEYGDLAEVDSAALIASLDTTAKVKQARKRLDLAADRWGEFVGPTAMLWVYEDQKAKNLYFGRKGNPLVIARDSLGFWLNSTTDGLPFKAPGYRNCPPKTVGFLSQRTFKTGLMTIQDIEEPEPTSRYPTVVRQPLPPARYGGSGNYGYDEYWSHYRQPFNPVPESVNLADPETCPHDRIAWRKYTGDCLDCGKLMLPASPMA